MKKTIEMSLETAREMYKDSTKATKLWLLSYFSVYELEELDFEDTGDAGLELKKKILREYEIPHFGYDSNMYKVMKIAYNIAIERAVEQSKSTFETSQLLKLKIK